MPKPNLDLLKGIHHIEDFTDEEKNQFAQAFIEGEGNPVTNAWQKIIKAEVRSLYVKLGGLPDEDLQSPKASAIVGQIREALIILNTPEFYITNWGPEAEGAEKK